MDQKVKTSRWLKVTAKVFLWTGVGLLFLLSATWFMLQTSSTQNYFTKIILKEISVRTNHDIGLKNIRISWFDEIEVSDFLLKDFSGDSLISAQTIVLNYNFSRLLSDKVIELEEVHFKSGAFNMIKHADSTDLNLTIFLDALKELKKDTISTKPITFGNVIIENFVFTMTDEKTTENTNKIDLSHLKLNIYLAEISDINIKNDSISFDIIQFLAKDHKKRLVINRINTHVEYTSKFLIFDNLMIETEHSIVGNYIHFTYNHPSEILSFFDSVDLFINIKNSRIHPHDARAFLGEDILKNPIDLSFEMHGKIADLEIKNLKLSNGQSKITSDILLIGLPNINETFMDISIEDSRIHSVDMKQYIPASSKLLDGFESINVNAVFTGFVSNFSTKASILTPLGEVKADVNIAIPKNKNQISYTGHLELVDFDLGILVGDTSTFQRASMKGRILGRGITRHNATFLVDMTATNIGVMDYSYDSMTFKGYLAEKHFYGHFSIDDPNCKISGKMNLDRRKTPEKIIVNASIDTLFTKRLHLTKQDFFLQTTIDLEQTNLTLDSLVGSLSLSETIFKLDATHTLALDAVRIETQLDSIARRVTLKVPGIEAELYGNWTLKGLSNFFKKELVELIGYFKLQNQLISFEEVVPLKAELKMKLNDINRYINFFNPAVSVSKNAILEMSFEQKEYSDAIVSVYAQADSIVYNDDIFLKNEVDAYTSMNADANDVLAYFLFSSQKQHWKTMPYSEKFRLEGIWKDDRIDVETMVQQPDTDTRISVNSEIIRSDERIDVSFKPSEVVILGHRWEFNPSNHIWLSRVGLSFDSFEIESESQFVSLSGILSDTLHTDMNFVSENIDVSQLYSDLGLPVEGVFNSNLSAYRQPGESFEFEGNFSLHNFLYRDVQMGNMNGTYYWDTDKEGVKVKISVDKEHVRAITIDGYYFPDKVEPFAFDISLDQADFQVLETFTDEQLTNVKGTASGNVRLTGSWKKPVLSGTYEINDGSLKVNYLQANYKFDGEIFFEKDQIKFKDFLLKDINGDSAAFKGKVIHKYFGSVTADIKVETEKFNFLNTISSDNDVYYGSVVASGDVLITGPLNDLVLKINIKTEEGTHFFIPLSDAEDYEPAEFISFIDLSDTIKSDNDVPKLVKQSPGATIDLDLEVTPDAYGEIIFDIKTGDVIRGRGTGNLQLKLDKDGTFELFGPLTINEGAYNFTVPNFINKEFKVVPGGTITWHGNPYTGSMDLMAKYRQRASFDNLDPSEQKDRATNQKIPVIVVLKFQGDMLAPNIEFDITLDESVNFVQNEKVNELIARIKSDEQQLKRQVVSLLFFKRFSPLQSSVVEGGVGKSLSELLTNQIGYLATQLDENLEVEVDLTDLGQEGLNTFQLRLAYTFFNGRLKVMKGGGNARGATAENQNLVNNIVGDWSVEYMLTKRGKFRAKIFSQTNPNSLNNDNQQNVETGGSLRYIESFNTFGKILGKTHSEAVRRKEEDE